MAILLYEESLVSRLGYSVLSHIPTPHFRGRDIGAYIGKEVYLWALCMPVTLPSHPQFDAQMRNLHTRMVQFCPPSHPRFQQMCMKNEHNIVQRCKCFPFLHRRAFTGQHFNEIKLNLAVMWAIKVIKVLLLTMRGVGWKGVSCGQREGLLWWVGRGRKRNQCHHFRKDDAAVGQPPCFCAAVPQKGPGAFAVPSLKAVKSSILTLVSSVSDAFSCFLSSSKPRNEVWQVLNSLFKFSTIFPFSCRLFCKMSMSLCAFVSAFSLDVSFPFISCTSSSAHEEFEHSRSSASARHRISLSSLSSFLKVGNYFLVLNLAWIHLA